MFFKKLRYYLILVFVSILTAGCTQVDNSTKDQTSTTLKYSYEDLDVRLAIANTQFAYSLYEKIIENEKEKNIFVSPFSISIALAMTYNGADKETKTAMEQSLFFQNMSMKELNEAYMVLQSLLENGDSAIQLNIANSLWAREGFVFKQDFLEKNENYYKAMINSLDFNDDKASDTINQWVKEKTKGKIEKIVDDKIHPLTVLFLINAIYFNGDWSEPFNEARTRQDIFYLPDGSSIQHPIMATSGDYDYYETELFQSVRLPYGDDRFGMYVFLPNESTTLTQFYQELNEVNWQSWLEKYQKVEGEILLPKFQVKYETNLNDVLKELGMNIAFDEKKANFSKMGLIPPNLFIGNVIHKAFIDVNEKGTEAAAVTSVEVRTESAPMYEFQMNVNRPFFFVIYDEVTKTILFMGSIVNPS